MRLLVTGGCGFIGSNFIRFWLKKYPKDYIINLDKLTYAGNPASTQDIAKDKEKGKRYRFVKGDIAKKNDVRKAFRGKVEVVVNFAAESHVDRSIYGPLEFIKTNVWGTAILLEEARTNQVKKFIHISSDEVFGQLALKSREKFTENTRYNPRSPYSASKAASDHLVYSYWATYGLPVVITNCSNNVGPYQYPEKFIPLAITNVLEGKPIRVYGKGENKRDWIWVLDHCRGIELAIKKGKAGQTYLFGGKDGARYTNLQIARMIIEKMGHGEIEFVVDRPGHDLCYDVDWRKAKSKLSWQPRYDVSKILSKTIKWYVENEWWWKSLKNKRVVIKHKVKKDPDGSS